jgi:hypothetical protein
MDDNIEAWIGLIIRFLGLMTNLVSDVLFYLDEEQKIKEIPGISE